MSIENTSESVKQNPLAAVLQYGAKGSIEASERRGQEQLVASDELPVEANGGDAPFIALGFSFGEALPGDPLFRRVTLPAGWQREATPHAMWSHIVDERGIPRVAVFYKAAFYDRRAFMRLLKPGSEMATAGLYGEQEPTAASLHLRALTDSELADFRASLDSMREQIRLSPHIYGDKASRLAICDALLAERER